MAIGHLTADYIAFVFNAPITSIETFAQLASWDIPALYWEGLSSLAASQYTSIPATRAGTRSNYWRIVSTNGGSYVFTERSAADPNSYPTPPSVGIDTYMYLWSNGGGTKGTMLAQNDDGGGMLTSQISYTLIAGIPYLIEVGSYSGSQTWNIKTQAYIATGADITGTLLTSL
jgi:hypothetical protein